MSSKRKRSRKQKKHTEPPEPRNLDQRNTHTYAACPGPCYLHVILFVLLLAVTCALYLGDLNLGFFHIDDPSYITRNPWIQGAKAENIGYILTQPYNANYSPLHLFSYMLDHQLSGLNPRVFHWSSNIWGGVAAGFVYLLALVFVRKWPLALAAAILFVVHPAHVEAVAWISSRKDLVAAAFALPATLTYFRYRSATKRRGAWYVVTLVLMSLGTAGKLSVVMVPVIWLFFDYFVERRREKMMILDKLPFAFITALFVIRVMGAQPATRYDPDFFVIGHSMLHNLTLLTGLGEYVIFRPRPDPTAAVWIQLACGLLPLVVFALPFLARRWIPGVALSWIYWVLLALIPSQVLSFVHPVADRYLFFPSVGVVILIAWLAMKSIERRRSLGLTVVPVLFVVLAVLWTWKTLAYLDEWRDPRSVWYSATAKSSDVNVYQYLGNHYQDAADRLQADLEGDDGSRKKAELLAGAVWAGDARLDPLLEEWKRGESNGPQIRNFQAHLRELAATQFQDALGVKGTRVSPNLYFRLGKLAFDTGDLPEAEKHFQSAIEEARKHTSREVREELKVRCCHALGTLAWRQKDYDRALDWLQEAENEQNLSTGNWIPDIKRDRERLEGIIRQRQSSGRQASPEQDEAGDE